MSSVIEPRFDLAAPAGPPLTAHYVFTTPAAALAQHGDRLMGVVTYGRGLKNGNDTRHIHVPLANILDDGRAVVWLSDRPVAHGRSGDIAFAHNDSVVMAHLCIPDTGGDLTVLSQQTYERIWALLEKMGYPHPIRIWNFFDDINAGADDGERYKQFCLGRAAAIQHAPDFESRLPAASAIGSSSTGHFTIYLLAGREIGLQVENPRQVSAFNYPRQYGPRSPSFSRARVLRWGCEDHLYLSGTASVIGHETVHKDDCRAQLEETLRNIETLLARAAALQPGLPAFGWQHARVIRTYLRRHEDFPMVKALLEQRLGRNAPVQYLCGDICRHDLLIEIEGLYVATSGVA